MPLIAEIQLFKELKDFGLKNETLTELASCMEYTTVPKDHFVFEYGDVGEHFFVILDGRVEVQIPLAEKRREHDMVRL